MSNSVIVNLPHLNFSKYQNMADILNTCCKIVVGIIHMML